MVTEYHRMYIFIIRPILVYITQIDNSYLRNAGQMHFHTSMKFVARAEGEGCNHMSKKINLTSVA